MNLPTIAIIIFALFFCTAWAGLCMSGTRIAAQSNSTPPHRWAPKSGSARHNEEKIKAVIDYVHQTNTPNFNGPPRRSASANSATATNLLWDSAGGSISSGGGRNRNRANKNESFANASQHQPQLQRTTSSSTSTRTPSTRPRRKKVQFKDTAGTSGGRGNQDDYDDMHRMAALARAREAKRLADEDVMDKLWDVEPGMDTLWAPAALARVREAKRLAEENVMDKLWEVEPSEPNMDTLWAPAAIRDHAQTLWHEAGQNSKGKSKNRSKGGKPNRAAAAAAPARGVNSKQNTEWPKNNQTARRRNRTRK